MKMYKYMLSGALAGYAMGCRMETLRRGAMRAAKRMKRMLSRKLGL
jgi:hypothetical protein